MNEKDLKRAREQYDADQTAKMMKAINENHQKAYERNLLNQHVKKIEREKQAKKETRLNIATIVVMIMMAILMIVMFVSGVKDYNDLANSCDDARGYTCSYYDVRQYSIGD